MSLIRRCDATGRASKKRLLMMAVAFKARYSFKMVISRPREHLARGQFNSGRMIAPSRSYCPFIFLRLPLSIRPTTPADPVRTRLYPGSDLATSIRLLLFRRAARSRLCEGLILFVFFPPPETLSLPLNYFDGDCLSLVSICVYSIQNFSIAINGSDQASSSVNTLNWCYSPTDY